MMKKGFLFTLIPFILLICSCDADSPSEPKQSAIEAMNENKLVTAQIKGFVWLDENSDGIWNNDEPLLRDAGVELVGDSEDERFGLLTKTRQDGSYSHRGVVGHDYYLVFTLPKAYESLAFTQQGVGEDEINSDVNSRGETEWFVLTKDFARVLSAGAIVVDPETRTHTIDDDLEDCREPGKNETHACSADISKCRVLVDPESGTFQFRCTVESLEDNTEFDFYVALNSDGDGATGKNGGLREGVDFELFGNGLEGQVYLNHYAADGQFIKSDLLQSTVASLTFEQDEIEGDIIQLDLTSIAALELPLHEKSAISFVVLHFPPDAAQLYDETPQITEIFQSPE
jgi:hypothetical protein